MRVSSFFITTKNTRSILPGNFRFLRSDVPDKLNKREIMWLMDIGVNTVVDLREPSERERKKCPLMDIPYFKYYCMSVTGGNKIPKSVDDVSKSYIKMADNRMDEIVEVILNTWGNVLYFCSAGKDRTGVLSAILLYRLGMSREYIVEDYMKSKENLKDMLEEYAKGNPDVDIEVITPHERYIEEFLDWYEAREK